MVTDRERLLIRRLVRLHVFRLEIRLRLISVFARPGFRWLLRRIERRQMVDNLHHAPCCQANHYHKMRLVFRPCNCGAWEEMT